MARKKKRSKRSGFRIPKGTVSAWISIAIRYMPIVLAVAIIAIGVKLSIFILLDSDYFKVKEIRTSGDEPDRKVGKIDLDLGLKKGLNIFKLDLKETESEIEYQHPELKDIVVRRVLPDTLEVSYKVRRPICQIDSGYFYLISDDAVVFPVPLAAADPELPVVTGVNISKRYLSSSRATTNALRKAVSILKEIEESRFSSSYKVIKLDIYDVRNPAIFIEEGTRIELGEYSFTEREKVLRKVLSDLASKNKTAKVIDLRFDDVVVIPR